MTEQAVVQAEATPEVVQVQAEAHNEALKVFEELVQKESPKPETELAEAVADEAKTEPAAAEAEAKPEEKGEEAPPAENKIAAVMRAKRQAQQIRDEASSEAARRAQELEHKERLLAEREAKVKEKLRSSPLEALRELGIDPREFLENAIKDPEKLEPIAEVKRELDEVKRQNQELMQFIRREREEVARRSEEAQRESVRQQFVRETVGSDKYKALKAFYGSNPTGLVTRAEALIHECINRGMDPNDIQNSEIAEFLEQEAREHYNSLRRQLEQIDEEASRPDSGNVSLTAKTASQKLSRRKKSVAEMTEDEARAEALRIMEAEFAGR